MWQGVLAAPADSILGLTEAFKKDSNPQKVNLGVGVYKDDAGNTPILDCVKAAEKILFENEQTKSYLPISGDPVYAECVQGLLFGKESEIIASRRAATVQAPGGTGSLRVGAELLKKFRKDATIWVSAPTWANHTNLFKQTGFSVATYPYYDAATKGLDFEAMIACLKEIPAGDVVLLHACCHNPSGVDASEEQWQEIMDVAKSRGWLPFLDFAYQGFGRGLEEDRFAVELAGKAGIDFFVASSFSKNFGLYKERAGALTVVAPRAEETEVAMSHMKVMARVVYSNPPAHGGLIVAKILSDAALTSMWNRELTSMRDRIVTMRTALVDGLRACGVDSDFSYIIKQKGMFSFSGLDEETVLWLRNERAIYVVGGGRINVAGLTSENIDYVCASIAEALSR